MMVSARIVNVTGKFSRPRNRGNFTAIMATRALRRAGANAHFLYMRSLYVHHFTAAGLSFSPVNMPIILSSIPHGYRGAVVPMAYDSENYGHSNWQCLESGLFLRPRHSSQTPYHHLVFPDHGWSGSSRTGRVDLWAVQPGWSPVVLDAAVRYAVYTNAAINLGGQDALVGTAHVICGSSGLAHPFSLPFSMRTVDGMTKTSALGPLLALGRTATFANISYEVYG